MADTSVYFNPSCSKCRTAQGILQERGLDADYIQYLDTPPTLADLRRLMGLLGIEDPERLFGEVLRVLVEHRRTCCSAGSPSAS